MIHLNDSLLIGKGRDRACYQHPENPGQCIKVALRPEKQSNREKAYFRYLKRQQADLSRLSQHLGTVETDFGVGHIYELQRENNSSLSPTLKQAIEDNLLDKQDVEQLVHQFENHLKINNICAYDLSPSNLIICKESENTIYLKLIDGVGFANSLLVHFPIKKYSDYILNNALTRLKNRVDKAFHYKALGQKPPKKQRKTQKQKLIERVLISLVLFIVTLSIAYQVI